jgi:hypothetical protein
LQRALKTGELVGSGSSRGQPEWGRCVVFCARGFVPGVRWALLPVCRHLPSRTAAAPRGPAGPGARLQRTSPLAVGWLPVGRLCVTVTVTLSRLCGRSGGARGGVGHSAAGRRVRASSLLQVKGKRRCPKQPGAQPAAGRPPRAAEPAPQPADPHLHMRIGVCQSQPMGRGLGESGPGPAVSFPRLGCVGHWPACPHGRLESCYDCTLHVAPGP